MSEIVCRKAKLPFERSASAFALKFILTFVLTFVFAFNCSLLTAHCTLFRSLLTAHGTLIRSLPPSPSLDKMVKIFGSGGLTGFENYQTGCLISADGNILTAASSVLDSEPIVCILNNGQRFEAVLKGIDPVRELAILKIDVKNQPFWPLDRVGKLPLVGDSVLALSNLYGTATGSEPVSVQRGCVSAITTLQARRGAFVAGYKGPAILIDAITNNPGAAGGVLIDLDGRFLGIIGKQLRSTEQQIWLNFVLPESETALAVEKILSGKSSMATSGENTQDEKLPELYWTVDLLGIQLVPNTLPKTLPYVDSVLADSGSADSKLSDATGENPFQKDHSDAAGNAPSAGSETGAADSGAAESEDTILCRVFRSDDLILSVNGTVVRNIGQLEQTLRRIDTADPLEILAQRGEKLVIVLISNNK